MSEKVLITKTSMDAIGDAIRYMRAEETEYLPSEMPAAIRGISPVLQSKTVTENGDYYPPDGFDGFSEFHVNVQGGGGSAVIQPLSVTQNGTYNPPSDVDGYAPVTVDVSGGSGSTFRASTKSVGGGDASLDIYVDETFIETVVYTDVSAGQYKDYDFVRVMYNTPASSSPDGVAHSGWCFFALKTCVCNGVTYIANQLLKEWAYNVKEFITVTTNTNTNIEVITLSVGSNGVYTAPSGKAYSPVSVSVSGGNSGISAGTADPIALYGSDGDIYIKYIDIANTAIEHTYVAEVTKFKRGTSDLNYVSAAEIDLVFDDGNGGEVSIRDISDFSYWATNGNGARSNPDAAFDNNAGSYAEYNPTPVTWFMSATIPPAYTPKTLRVMQRDYGGGTDVWSSFTLSDAVDDVGASVEILSEENLQTTDWAGVRQWTDFACNGAKVGGKVPLKYFVKENGSWNEVSVGSWLSAMLEKIS